MRLKSRKLFGLPILSCLFLLIFQGCTEKKYIFVDNKIELSGEVLAYFCDYETWGRDERYSVATGKPAVVSFVSESGIIQSTTTDDSSSFMMFLDSGKFDVIVETGHSFPYTFPDVLISKDSILELAIPYGWYDDDTVWVNFAYSSPNDTLGLAVEVEHIKRLNYLIGGDFIEVFDSRQVVVYDFPMYYQAHVQYAMPVVSGAYVFDVSERSYILMKTPELGFPAGMSCWISTYICHFD